MIPTEKTIAVVEHQLEGAQAWAERRGFEANWDPDSLELRVTFTQPETGREFYLRGRFDGYPALPPEWTFCDEDWESCGEKTVFPSRPNEGNTMIHGQGILCAHFNRLAFREHGGPHGDWGGPAQWITPKNSTVYADTIGDMLGAIWRDFRETSGTMQ
jgi:hypothetical protein